MPCCALARAVGYLIRSGQGQAPEATSERDARGRQVVLSAPPAPFTIPRVRECPTDGRAAVMGTEGLSWMDPEAGQARPLFCKIAFATELEIYLDGAVRHRYFERVISVHAPSKDPKPLESDSGPTTPLSDPPKRPGRGSS